MGRIGHDFRDLGLSHRCRFTVGTPFGTIAYLGDWFDPFDKPTRLLRCQEAEAARDQVLAVAFGIEPLGRAHDHRQ